jgi:hypothetical protein
MDSRAERKKKLETKIRILWIVAVAQVWLWPVWFAYVVHTGPAAVSSFITMIGAAIYNVHQLLFHYDKVNNLFYD